MRVISFAYVGRFVIRKGIWRMDERVYVMEEQGKVIMTLAEYEALPEDVRVELIEGEIFVMEAPSWVHQQLVLRIAQKLCQYIDEKKGACAVTIAPFDVLLDDNPDKPTVVQPDVLVICDKDKLTERRCEGAPDFAVEITSPSGIQRDYVKKLNLYHDKGVREYWIVNPVTQEIVVYLFGEEMELLQYTFNDKVKVHIYEDLYIDFAELSQLI